MTNNFDGFYAAYISGSNGNGFVMFVFSQGTLVGCDLLGVKFDGTYSEGADQQISGSVDVIVPPNGEVIQGVKAGPDGMNYSVPFTLSPDFLSAPYIALDTPLGPVNMRLEKLRGLGGAS